MSGPEHFAAAEAALAAGDTATAQVHATLAQAAAVVTSANVPGDRPNYAEWAAVLARRAEV